jgi:hypothetical protein
LLCIASIECSIIIDRSATLSLLSFDSSKSSQVKRRERRGVSLSCLLACLPTYLPTYPQYSIVILPSFLPQ